MAIDFSPRTVYVSGSYGAGKSAAVCEHIARSLRVCHNLLVICYRQSQGLDFAGKMTNYRIPFTFYLGQRPETIQKHKARMLISTQSLAKICPLIQYDTVVIDETTSLLLDSATSDLVPKQNLEILVHIIRHAGKLICMDVNLPASTIAMISYLRGIMQLYLGIQTIPKEYPNHIVFEDNLDIWRCGILEELLMGKNIVICSDSKKELLALCQDIPDTVRKRVYVCGHPYTAELQNVNVVWTKFQLVAYSPSIVTATSFTNAHFHTVYGLFTYSSLSARSFAQQLHRVRNIASRTVVLHSLPPKSKFLRNQSKMVQEFDPLTGEVCESDTPINKLKKLHNEEIERTYKDFKSELLSSIYANADANALMCDSNSPSSPSCSSAGSTDLRLA